MALSSVERVRNKIGDKSQLRRERVTADGASDRFKLKYEPVNLTPAPQVWVEGSLQTDGVDYTVDYDHGIITFAASPSVNETIVFQYYAVVWTDTDIQDMLDQYGSNINVTSAHILYAWAADAAKLAKRETRSGGGGVGAHTIDTSLVARELRNTAKALIEWELEYGDTLGTHIPAEGITEVPWTEAAFLEIEHQRFIREN